MMNIAFISDDLVRDNEDQPHQWIQIALKRLRMAGYYPFILSDEPEANLDQYKTWLNWHNLAGYSIALREPGTGMITTPQWKAKKVNEITFNYRNRLESILFIDSDVKSCEAIANLNRPNIRIMSDLSLFYNRDELF